MPGFNYGGQGDGTNWSSERGSGPAPGGGTGTGGNGGNSGGSSSVSYKNYGGVAGPLSQREIDDAINEVAATHRPIGGLPGKAEAALNARVSAMSGEERTAALKQVQAAREDAIARGVLGRDGAQSGSGNASDSGIGNNGPLGGSNKAHDANSPPTTWDRTANYYGSSNVVSRNALKNMYEKAVSTGSIPAEASGELRQKVQAMLDDDKRQADAKAAAEAEKRRQAAETERQRQAYEAAVKANASAVARAEATVNAAENTRVATEKSLQDARSRQAAIGNLPSTWDRTVTYYGASDQVSRKAVKNLYEKAVRTGVMPKEASGKLRDSVQAMLNEDKRLADARVAAEAEVQRLTTALANAQQAVANAKKQLADTIAQAAEDARRKQVAEAERQRQIAEAAEKAKNEREVLEKTSELIAAVGDKAGEYLGDKYSEVAKDISRDIKNFQGKTIRNYNDAMASLNKVMSNPAMKINQADKDALVNAWKALNAQDMANKLGNLSKAFKAADVAMKAEKVRQKIIEGHETGNWGPLMLEVESWVLSGMASSVALGIFSAILGSALLAAGVPAVVVGIMGIMTMVYIGSLIDDKFADALNNEVIRPAH